MKKVLIDGSYDDELRIALVNENIIEEYKYSDIKQHILGNIYLAKVVKIEPSLQAAFISYQKDKTGFLSFSEIHPDYYNQKGNISDILKTIQILDSSVDNENQKEESQNKIKEQKEHEVNASNTVEIEGDLLNQNELGSIINDGKSYDKYGDIEIEELKQKIETTESKSIQNCIFVGQYLLVQVSKEERGTKAPAFTTYISLVGKYIIMHPNLPRNTGVSRRITDLSEKKRIKSIINDILSLNNVNSHCSIIARTACLGKRIYDIKNDYVYLCRLWNEIVNSAVKEKKSGLIHKEDDLLSMSIKDLLDHRVENVFISGEKEYQRTLDFVKATMPSEISKINLYNNKQPIFSYFHIEDQISNLFKPIVSLPSGGYIIINPTEALTSIDVNSGKSTSEKTLEDMALNTNLEASKEIARQLKLREISGIIVIDFIDMRDKKNHRLVEMTFKQNLKNDNARMYVGSISDLGILEMSRQRIQSSFLETYSKECGTCSGKGVVRSMNYNSILILRTIEDEVSKVNPLSVNIFAHPNVIVDLINTKKNLLVEIEKKHSIKINFKIEDNKNEEIFGIEFIGQKPKKHVKQYTKNDAIATKDIRVPEVKATKEIKVIKESKEDVTTKDRRQDSKLQDSKPQHKEKINITDENKKNSSTLVSAEIDDQNKNKDYDNNNTRNPKQFKNDTKKRYSRYKFSRKSDTIN